MSSKLLTEALLRIMKSRYRNEKGIHMGARLPLNLRFADDIVLFSNSTAEAEDVLTELGGAVKRMRMRINR